MNGVTVLKVGMADMKVAASGESLRTMGLGSCVGLVLYDELQRIAGMAHIMLPSSSITRENRINPAKYADTAVPGLVDMMKRAGADPGRLVAKMAGGAQMFHFAGEDVMRIGPRNVESVKEALKKLGIRLIAEDTGGNYGRTVEFDSRTGVLHIRSVQHGVKEI